MQGFLSHEWRRWRVGFELEKMERGEIERAVRTLILDDEGEEMRAGATDLKKKVVLDGKGGGCSHSSLNELVNLVMSF